MSKWNIALVGALLFVSYFSFNCWQDEKIAKEKVTTLTDQIDQLNKNIDKNNQIIAQREQEKSQDAISIKQLHEQMKNALKNNQCANEYMPDNVINWMRVGEN
ncbi:hypothetical protein [Gilliamella sp. B2838]|uniref:hypothetical protein n=1 Tax=Gilliamella sp. B2838 TaxID=2818020 RepID=UPI00226AC287|nr:hypothetical protein [Gilliamella sp. B2838]MCX8726977.1 hypothetical protein [Gilliamella sp. B2838]